MKVERRTVDFAAYPDLVVIYLGMKVNAMTGLVPLGLSSFAPTKIARGAMFSARTRLGVQGSETASAPVSEASLYGEGER